MNFSLYDQGRVSFVHPPRCGGASMVKAIQVSRYPEQKFFFGNYAHQPAFEMRMFESWKDSYKFTIVRNPWSRMVSMYNAIFIKKLNRIPEYLPHLSVHEAEYVGCQTARLGFKWFIKEFKEPIWNYPQSYPMISPGQGLNSITDPQMCWITMNGKVTGDVELDKIFKFEDMPGTYEYLEVEPDKIRGWTPYCDGSYMDYYDDETKDIVAERFKGDILRLDYEFEGPEFPHVAEDGDYWQDIKARLSG